MLPPIVLLCPRCKCTARKMQVQAKHRCHLRLNESAAVAEMRQRPIYYTPTNRNCKYRKSNVSTLICIKDYRYFISFSDTILQVTTCRCKQ
jgi:hypothetical protein